MEPLEFLRVAGGASVGSRDRWDPARQPRPGASAVGSAFSDGAEVEPTCQELSNVSKRENMLIICLRSDFNHVCMYASIR